MYRLGLVTVLLVLGLYSAVAAEFKLSNGDILRGEPSSFNDTGFVVRLDLGGFSDRVPWGKFTQETLQQLMEIPEAQQYVEPYIDVPVEIKEQARKQKQDIRVMEPPQVPHVEVRPGFFASMMNPLGLTLLVALYLANLYSGYLIARFRGRPVALVVGAAAVVPIIGPALFAALPGGHASVDESAAAAAPAATEGINPMQQALPSGMAGSNLGLASTGQGGKGAANPAYTTVHSRSNTTFDRRFFEIKFAGFFRVMPVEPEKDLAIVVKTPKKELVAVRISRVSAAEIHFQLQRGAEESLPFSEITEVSVRPRGK